MIIHVFVILNGIIIILIFHLFRNLSNIFVRLFVAYRLVMLDWTTQLLYSIIN